MGRFNGRIALTAGLAILVGGGGLLVYRLTAEAKDSTTKPAPKASTTAPADAPKDDKPALWGKTCQTGAEGKQACAVVQNVIITDKNTNKSMRALTVAVGYLAADGKLRMVLTLPLGINLPPGVGFQIDEGKANTLPVETCLADGCRVAMAIDDSGRDSLSKSKAIRVTYQLANGQNLVLPIQLAGFGDALAKLTP
jgi:invasion protein IalB